MVAGTKCLGKWNAEVGVRTIEEQQRNKGAMLCNAMQWDAGYVAERRARETEKMILGRALLRASSQAGNAIKRSMQATKMLP